MAGGAHESDFIARMRQLATSPQSRNLADDAALLNIGGARLVLTTDTLVEGVHYRADDPPADIGWKLAAVNLSDLAGKGAQPAGCLLNYALSGDARWDAEFARGLGEALERHAMPLLGGDTVTMPSGAPRALSLTAIGSAGGETPARCGVRPGDTLYVTRPVGDAGAGLRLLEQGQDAPASLVAAYRRPTPCLNEGMALAPLVHAMMDISDGLLIDAQRMAQASGLAIRIDHIPLSADLVALEGDSLETRLRAASAGDDYELLLALPADATPPAGLALIRVGTAFAGTGLSLRLEGTDIPLPDRLGYEHGAPSGHAARKAT